MKTIHRIRKAAVLVTSLVILGGVLPTTEAQAITSNYGDLYLVIFGNTIEYVQDLGIESSLLSPLTATTFQIPWGSDAGSIESLVSGPYPVQWEIIGVNDDATLYAGSSADAANTNAPGGVQNATNSAASFIGQMTVIPGTSSGLVGAGSIPSFTYWLGTHTLAGNFTTNMQGGIGSMLYLISADYNTNALTDIGTASLVLGNSLDLTICGLGASDCTVQSAPLPASLVLFATGLVGLVGLVRRTVISA